MKSQLSLSTDKKSVSEGEFLEITWKCDACPDSLLLTIDSGYKRDTIAVADSGSTRIIMSRSQGKTAITLKGVISGKKVSETVHIRVKNFKGSSPHSTGVSKWKIWKEKMQAKWYVFRANVKYWWLSQKKWQKALWIGILVFWLYTLIGLILPAEPQTDTPQKPSATSVEQTPSKPSEQTPSQVVQPSAQAPDQTMPATEQPKAVYRTVPRYGN